jgi:hypothetical protein
MKYREPVTGRDYVGKAVRTTWYRGCMTILYVVDITPRSTSYHVCAIRFTIDFNLFENTIMIQRLIGNSLEARQRDSETLFADALLNT